ncbi:MAG: hypothetical protein IME93_03630 [Proteobacteria bacterium]|nr:hypothetical protein [Pseudomonadota bacterium]
MFGRRLSGIIFLVSLLLVTACSKDDMYLFLTEASFGEQFSSACNGVEACTQAVDIHIGACINKELMLSAIEAEPELKKAINTRHILEVQACLAKKAGKDYWKSIDMPGHILSKVK